MPASGVDHMRERAESFQRLRQRVLAWYFVPGMAFFLATIAALIFDAPQFLQLGFFTPAMILHILGSLKYRCPVCDRIPGVGEDGIDFNPKECANCATILRWDE
jgi:hypothetical protein